MAAAQPDLRRAPNQLGLMRPGDTLHLLHNQPASRINFGSMRMAQTLKSQQSLYIPRSEEDSLPYASHTSEQYNSLASRHSQHGPYQPPTYPTEASNASVSSISRASAYRQKRAEMAGVGSASSGRRFPAVGGSNHTRRSGVTNGRTTRSSFLNSSPYEQYPHPPPAAFPAPTASYGSFLKEEENFLSLRGTAIGSSSTNAHTSHNISHHQLYVHAASAGNSSRVLAPTCEAEYSQYRPQTEGEWPTRPSTTSTAASTLSEPAAGESSLSYLLHADGATPAAGHSTSSSYIPQLGKSIYSFIKGGFGRVAGPTRPRAAADPATPIGCSSGEIDRLTGNNSQEVFEQMIEDQQKNRIEETDRQYLDHRQRIILWMANLGDKLKMRRATVHVGIQFLDRIFHGRLPNRDKWQMLAVSCLQVAAKYEEAEENVPAVSQLARASGIVLTIQTMQKWEVVVLQGLEWKLTTIIPLHFVEYYLTRGVLFLGDYVMGKPLSLKSQQAPNQLRKYTLFFAQYITIHNFGLMEHKQRMSYLAAVILYCARYAINTTPIWRNELGELTGFSDTIIEECAHDLLRRYKEEFAVSFSTINLLGTIPDPPSCEWETHYSPRSVTSM